ncbi:hypothetical protein A2U01_0103411, partial [Trifolium medium]|nr:hypothetical protein [Trifolium medium]
ILHLYIIPLLLGDPSRPAEMESLVEEQAEREGSMAADLAVTNSEVRQLAPS